MTARATLELLRGISILAALDELQLERLAAAAEVGSLPAGAWLFHVGEEAHAAYVVASGRLEVIAEESGTGVVRVLRRGDAVGELALLRGGRRSASIRAQRDSTLVALQRTQFDELLDRSPAFAIGLTRALGEQLASALAPAASAAQPRTLALVGLHDAVDPAGAGAMLTEELEHFLTTAYFREPPAADPGEWASHLARAEAQNDRVVMLAGGEEVNDPWSAFCLGEADLIVALTAGDPDQARLARACGIVGHAELVSVDGAISDEVIGRHAPRNLRVVHGSDGLRRAMGELARRVCGRALGVVLSGGGARAFSHLGVIEELTRNGVRIDRVGGVSLGALIAASVARGDSDEARLADCRRYFVEQNPANDYTLPLVALTRGRKLARLMEEAFGAARIEQLPLPFFCTSTDLEVRRQVVHRSGPLTQALLATVALPGVFPPVIDSDGHALVDGGVLGNLPVRVMAEDNGGPVIAVDVTSLGNGNSATRRARAEAGVVRSLRRRITGSEVSLPRLQETIVRCMTLGSADAVARASEHADLVITPDVSHVGLLDWRRLPEAREAGVRAARAAIALQPDLFARL